MNMQVQSDGEKTFNLHKSEIHSNENIKSVESNIRSYSLTIRGDFSLCPVPI